MPLTTDRNTPRRDNVLRADLAAATIFAGALYTLNAAGAASPAKAADTKPVRAVAHARAEAGDLVEGRVGCFRFGNAAAAAAVTKAEIGANAFVVDDQTVGKTGTSIAGVIVDVDADGVWVNVGTAAGA